MDIKEKTLEVIDIVSDGASKVAKNAVELKQKIDKNHAEIADHADTVAKGTKVVAGIAVTGAIVAAPAGLTAIGVSLGLVSAPLIVTVAPVLAGAAGAAFTISAAASLYSKYRRKKEKEEVPCEPEDA